MYQEGGPNTSSKKIRSTKLLSATVHLHFAVTFGNYTAGSIRSVFIFLLARNEKESGRWETVTRTLFTQQKKILMNDFHETCLLPNPNSF